MDTLYKTRYGNGDSNDGGVNRIMLIDPTTTLAHSSPKQITYDIDVLKYGIGLYKKKYSQQQTTYLFHLSTKQASTSLQVSITNIYELLFYSGSCSNPIKIVPQTAQNWQEENPVVITRK